MNNNLISAAQGILNRPPTSGGVVLNGLKTRVEEEAQLFLYPKTSEIIYT
jgi:GH24 family phage-related lysozyme (muramidase)